MIIEIGVVAAAAMVSGFLAARAVRKKREAEANETPLDELPSPAKDTPDPFAGLAARVGDVIQHGDATRWTQSAIVVRCEDEVVCAVLLSDEDGEHQATVAMAPPNRQLYWLKRADIELPNTPPARLEIDGYLLDRKQLLSAAFSTLGAHVPDVGDDGRFAVYEGTVGDAAVIVAGDVHRVWYGRRLTEDEFDCLGQGERDT